VYGVQYVAEADGLSAANPTSASAAATMMSSAFLKMYFSFG
jgi:hypothetical protein